MTKRSIKDSNINTFDGALSQGAIFSTEGLQFFKRSNWKFLREMSATIQGILASK